MFYKSTYGGAEKRMETKRKIMRATIEFRAHENCYYAIRERKENGETARCTEYEGAVAFLAAGKPDFNTDQFGNFGAQFVGARRMLKALGITEPEELARAYARWSEVTKDEVIEQEIADGERQPEAD